MNTKKLLPILAFLALLPVPSARAQIIDLITLGKEQHYTQNTNSTASAATNFQFSSSVEGSTLSGIATPTLNSNNGGTGPTGPFVYNASDDGWFFEQNYGTGPLLEAAYPSDGSGYSLTVLGQTFSIPLPSEAPLRFTPIPLATLSAGTIAGGVLIWDVSQPLTISLIDPLNGSLATVDHTSLSIWGTNIDLHSEAFGNATQSFTIPGTAGMNNSFIAGQSYTVEMDFVNITGGSSLSTISGGALDGVEYGSFYARTTSFTIQAIPEPSTCAGVLAAVALAAAVRHRRKQRGLAMGN